MADFSRGEFIGERFECLVDVFWPDLGTAETFTTYALFREVAITDVMGNKTRTGMGEPKKKWIQIVDNQPCIFNTVLSEVDERFLSTIAGSLKQDMVIMRTSFNNIKTGDNVRLDFDGVFYLVQAAGYEGSLRWALLDASQNRLTSYNMVSS